MPIDHEPKLTHPRWMGVVLRWRNFCEQWRHCYLLLLVMFLLAWRLSIMAFPILENTRTGGLHPGDVVLLMDVPRMMWWLPLVAAVLYALSFCDQAAKHGRSSGRKCVVLQCGSILRVYPDAG